MFIKRGDDHSGTFADFTSDPLSIVFVNGALSIAVNVGRCVISVEYMIVYIHYE